VSEPIDRAPEKPARQPIFDSILDLDASSNLGHAMRVGPAPVRPLQLDIGEGVRGDSTR
jgi:hypothetical protein